MLVAALSAMPLTAKAETGWRSAMGAKPQSILVAKSPATADLRQADGAGRSVVVRPKSASSEEAAPPFDPFESPLADGDVPMPTSDPASKASSTQSDNEQPTFDPFDEPVAQVGGEPERATQAGENSLENSPSASSGSVTIIGNEPVIEHEAISTPAIEEAFSEARLSKQPSAAEQVEKSKQVIEDASRHESSSNSAAAELVIAEQAPVVQPEQAETAASENEVSEELVGPAETEETPEEQPARRSAEEEIKNLEMQYGGGAQPQTAEQIEARRRQLETERIQQDKECQELMRATRAASLKTISLDIRQQGVAGEDYPFGCSPVTPLFQPRSWPQVTYQWKASGLCHKPLYFEEPQLERYGHDWGPALQPIMSGAHFFGTIPILPYKMGLETPQECIYTLGYYRPGSCAPYMCEPLGFTWRAAALEAAVWTGGVIAIP
jgi:hypothetical protein